MLDSYCRLQTEESKRTPHDMMYAPCVHTHVRTSVKKRLGRTRRSLQDLVCGFTGGNPCGFVYRYCISRSGDQNCALEMLTKWSQLTRLETRTKESNICASIMVSQTMMHNESEMGGQPS